MPRQFRRKFPDHRLMVGACLGLFGLGQLLRLARGQHRFEGGKSLGPGKVSGAPGLGDHHIASRLVTRRDAFQVQDDFGRGQVPIDIGGESGLGGGDLDPGKIQRHL